jgi:hypothetical protein
MQAPCGVVIGAGGVLCCRVEAHSVQFPPYRDLCEIGAIRAFLPYAHSLKARSAIRSHALVLTILRRGAEPQIAAPIVEHIHVDVIHEHFRWGLDYEPV